MTKSFKIASIPIEMIVKFIDILTNKIMSLEAKRYNKYVTIGDTSSYHCPRVITESTKEADFSVPDVVYFHAKWK